MSANRNDLLRSHEMLRLVRDFASSAEGREVAISAAEDRLWIVEFRDDDGGWWEGRSEDLAMSITLAHESWEKEDM
jgi:hypothetical protein